MVGEWKVKFTDDEDGTLIASFNSLHDADIWIRNQEMQERYDPCGFEVIDGPYILTSSRVLTEGKHWPTDYIKTGVNLVKASLIGLLSWYSDDLIAKDMQTFADEFEPLSHKSSNLGFFSTIVKWFIAYSGSSALKYQEFIERKLDGIIGALQVILNDPSYDKIKDEIKLKWSLSLFEELQKKINDEAKASSDEKLKSIVKRDDYELVPINSYEELNLQFGGRWTGYKGKSKWCHTNGQSTYDSWTKNGTLMFFVLANKDWKKILPPDPDSTNAYDKYGTSLIAILVDVISGNLLNETLRWNHVIKPSATLAGASVDKAFKNNWGELSLIVGMDVKSEVAKMIKGGQDKLKKIADSADIEVAKILKNVKIITDATIPKEYRPYVTKIDIPNGVESIGDWAFNYYSSLTSVTISNSVTSIGWSAFDGCSGLTSITIGSGVTSIGWGAFSGCRGLTSVTIPDSVSSIGDWAFYSCSKLTGVTIGSSITSIGYNTFNQCMSLKLIVFKGKTIEEVKKMENYPFGIEDKSIIEAKKTLDESIAFDPIAYAKYFKDYFGYEDQYMPDSTYKDKADSIAIECALMMPDSIEAILTGCDAVMMLVLSKDEEAIETGKKLGDCMIAKGNFNKSILLKYMANACRHLSRLAFKRGEYNINGSLNVKLWIDDLRTPPRGYTWLRSVNDFIDFIDKNGVSNIEVIDLGYDAGDYAQDGGDYIKCLNYLEFLGTCGIRIRVHSTNPIGVKRMKDIIKKNQWEEVYDIIDDSGADVYLEDEDTDVDECFDGGSYDDLAAESQNLIDEAEDSATKDKIVSALKKLSKDFLKAASNNDPQLFAKITVAFDDLTSGVGAYDFKKKKVVTEDGNSQLSFDDVVKLIQDAGAECNGIECKEIDGKTYLCIYGKFNGNGHGQCFLDKLTFYFAPLGIDGTLSSWHESTRCMNLWRGKVKDILDNAFPNGIDTRILEGDDYGC